MTNTSVRNDLQSRLNAIIAAQQAGNCADYLAAINAFTDAMMGHADAGNFPEAEEVSVGDCFFSSQDTQGTCGVITASTEKVMETKCQGGICNGPSVKDCNHKLNSGGNGYCRGEAHRHAPGCSHQ